MILPGYMICLVLAYLFIQTGRVRNERELTRRLSELVEHFGSGFALYHIDLKHNVRLQFVNDAYFSIFEETRETLFPKLEKSLLTGIHSDDLEAVREHQRILTEELRDHELTYRYITDEGKTKWILVRAQIARQPDGSAIGYSTYTDITAQKQDQERLSDLIDTVPCGICLYRWDGAELTPLIVNHQFSEMLGEDAMGYLQGVKELDYTHVHPDDLAGLRQASLDGLQGNGELDYTYRTRNAKTNQYVWLRLRGTMLPKSDGTRLVYVSYYDVTQEHMAEQTLRENEQMLEFAAEYAGLWYWRYDAKANRAYLDVKTHQEDFPLVIENYPEAWFELGYIMPDSVPAYREAIGRIRAGEKDVSFEAQAAFKPGALQWMRFRFTNLFDADGNVTVAICTAMSIEAERELWAKYEMERRRPSVDDENLLVHAVINLSTGETLEYRYQDGTDVPVENRDAFTYSAENVHLLIDENERAQFLDLNDPERLLERFANGETEFRLEYRRLLKTGEVSWVRSVLHLVRDPRSGDVLLFEYWYDIEEEKMLEMMYQSIATDNFDYVARINGRTKHFKSLPKAGLSDNIPPLIGDDADEVTRCLYDQYVLPEDVDYVVQNMLLDGMRQNLRATGRFTFTYRELLPGGNMRYKKITQYYIDPLREIIAVMREDVTDLMREQSEKNRILADALSAANQAIEAKSQFLSRVSHELRTPLSAIIGFLELARDAEPDQLSTYLANSDLAAKQLLSVINDVLDMSSIESGKMKIAHSPFDFKHMLQSITNIYVEQCRQKGVAYETTILTPIDEWLIGDQLRVNQILINLLGNAVKFTTSGHIWLRVRQTGSHDDKVFLRFEISDTGCGMSEELRARLFKPFEQENATTAQKYGGSGLGLSIVKNLVSMMDGVISVDSKLGEGSTFTVDLPFRKNDATALIPKVVVERGLRVLAVDDEPAERDYLAVVLERIGVRSSCVSSGDEALRALEQASAKNDPYNVCLIDWKMPNMNGIEATRRIRQAYGQDVVVIVVSAYEHYQASESAKMAGASMFITKPLFQSSLFDLFSTLTDGRIAREKEEPTKRDFTGKRVLLAEDNAMNRIVTENILKRFNMAYELAFDGKLALDAFLASAPGHFDAILMDIQMPNMDGIEAAKAIRASSHPDAKSIQIIALTANAFNEDVSKTLSSGMNAHVSKPIQSEVLARALTNAFASNAEREEE